MNGFGEYTWPDGRVYKGNFANDNKQGDGILYYPDGSVYSGQWFANK